MLLTRLWMLWWPAAKGTTSSSACQKASWEVSRCPLVRAGNATSSTSGVGACCRNFLRTCMRSVKQRCSDWWPTTETSPTNVRLVNVYNTYMMTSWHASALLALCEGNPPVTGGFPSQRVSKAWLCCLLCCECEKIAEQTVGCLVNWSAVMLM